MTLYLSSSGALIALGCAAVVIAVPLMLLTLSLFRDAVVAISTASFAVG